MSSRLLIASALLLTAALGNRALGQSNSSTDSNPYPPDTPGASHASLDLRKPGPGPNEWLYPVTKLDKSLPPWVQFGAQFRDRVESQDGFTYKALNDTYDLTQLRVGIYIQPAKWLELVGVTQDARAFFNHHVPDGPPYQNLWDVREAYVQLGSGTEGWLDAVAGRQILSFGDERVIGPSDWLNMGRTFDVLRVDLHHPGFKASIFASSVIIARDGVVDHHLEGNNLYGIYVSLDHIVPHATLEPYLLWRVAPGNIKLPEDAGLGHFSEVTGGGRLAGTLAGAVDYDLEMNKQAGSLGSKSIDAWAGHWNVGYVLNRPAGKPRLFAEYNYASGNKNPNGSTWGTHDQIYPSAHDKMEFADQFGWRNIEDLRIGVNEKLGKKWTLTQVFEDLWLATKNDAVYSSSGGIAIAAHPAASSTHLGTELDLISVYQQNPHVTYGFGFAHIFTGRFLNEATAGREYNYPYASTTYIF